MAAGRADLPRFTPAKPQNRRRHSQWRGFRKEYMEQLWEHACGKLGLDLTLYEATRHSFIWRNLASGVSLDEVSAAVGHSSPVVTKRFYGRFVRRNFSAAIRGGMTVEVSRKVSGSR